MAKAKWSVIFEDKTIVNSNYDNGPFEQIGKGYIFRDSQYDSFWSDPKFDNIWAIQYGVNPSSDEVEYADNSPHTSYADANLGDFTTQFISKWDAAHLTELQSNWDNNNVEGETEVQKIARLGTRPTSYSSL
jgi:hypothetical protein